MKQPEISWSIQGGAVVKELTVSTLKRRVVFSAPNMRGLLDKVRGLPFAAPVSYDDFRRGGEQVKRAILGAVAAYYDADAVRRLPRQSSRGDAAARFRKTGFTGVTTLKTDVTPDALISLSEPCRRFLCARRRLR